MKKYYAVRVGRVPGIYETWEECKEQVMGYSGAEFKSFQAYNDAVLFIKNEEKKVEYNSEAIAYVDGSFSKDKSMFSYGAVIFLNGEKQEFSKAFEDPDLVSMRNVAGEIKGAEFVMEYCVKNNIKSIDIYYDYEGIEKWCTGVWQTNKSGTQKYKEFYNRISKELKVNFVKVKGHSGNEYNDLADKLAKGALGIE